MGPLSRTVLLPLALGTLLVVAAATAGATTSHLSIEADGSDAEAGGQTTISIRFANNGDEPTGAIVDVTDIPDGWEITNHSDDGGTWNSDESKWLFQRVQDGGRVEPSVTLSIPDEASGEYEVAVQGTDGETNVTATATVEIEGEETETAIEDGDSQSTNTDGPGFTAGLALLALLGGTLLVACRD
jgi:PGF-CTERM protein